MKAEAIIPDLNDKIEKLISKNNFNILHFLSPELEEVEIMDWHS